MSRDTKPAQSTRRSPIQHWLETRSAQWTCSGDMPIAVRLQFDGAERAAIERLALCDVSALRKLGVKGPGAASWLEDQGVDVPDGIYHSARLADGGLVVRLAADEFLLESGIANESVPMLDSQLAAQSAHGLRVTRQEATFLLLGTQGMEVMAQTCGVNLRQAPRQQLVLTRVAGVSCGVFPESIADLWACRLWVDYTYALYLWETLVQVCEDLGGSVVGAECIFAELRA